MARRKTRRPSGKGEAGQFPSAEASLAAAHEALDELEKALATLPGADHLIDLVLQVRRGVIEAAPQQQGSNP